MSPKVQGLCIAKNTKSETYSELSVLSLRERNTKATYRLDRQCSSPKGFTNLHLSLSSVAAHVVPIFISYSEYGHLELEELCLEVSVEDFLPCGRLFFLTVLQISPTEFLSMKAFLVSDPLQSE